MAVNWVMRSDEGGFTPLPGEQRLYSSPARTAFNLQSVNRPSGRNTYSLNSSAGVVHITNRRIVYLPGQSSERLQSFTAPILNVHDSRVTAPFFGPNVWTAVVASTPGGGIPAEHPAVELKFTFKDGGAFDFHTAFERVKERLGQAVETARESGALNQRNQDQGRGRGGGPLSGVGLNNVHLDELPAYEPRTTGRTPAPGGPPNYNREQAADSGIGDSPTPSSNTKEAPPDSTQQQPVSPAETDPVFTPPNEPPPGYEEVQADSIARELELALRDAEDQRDDSSQR